MPAGRTIWSREGVSGRDTVVANRGGELPILNGVALRVERPRCGARHIAVAAPHCTMKRAAVPLLGGIKRLKHPVRPLHMTPAYVMTMGNRIAKAQCVPVHV